MNEARWLQSKDPRRAELYKLMRDEIIPHHQPRAWEAPIPGRHWYQFCEDAPHPINPDTGRCINCGGEGCVVCGREKCGKHS